MVTSMETVKSLPRWAVVPRGGIGKCLPTKMEEDRRGASSIIRMVRLGRLGNGGSPLAVIDFAVDRIGEHAVDSRAHHFEGRRQALVLLRELRIQHGELAHGLGA